MDTAFTYLALSGVLAVLLWVPYILARMVSWGLPTFIHNYPAGFPQQQPTPPLWAQRAQRAHLNMVETLPAFAAVLIAAHVLAVESADIIALWAAVFFFARLAHAVVYTLGTPFLRTPTYLVSWAAVLMIGAQALA